MNIYTLDKLNNKAIKELKLYRDSVEIYYKSINNSTEYTHQTDMYYLMCSLDLLIKRLESKDHGIKRIKREQ